MEARAPSVQNPGERQRDEERRVKPSRPAGEVAGEPEPVGGIAPQPRRVAQMNDEPREHEEEQDRLVSPSEHRETEDQELACQ